MSTRGDRRLGEALKERAVASGFALAGITSPVPSGHMDSYRAWLANGHHGEMSYLARPDAVARRADLTGTMANARSVLVVAHEYSQDDGAEVSTDPAQAVIARYARGDDYHDVVKAKLQDLLAWLGAAAGADVQGRAYVDTGPLLERELAQRAGLGWFGRNTMLINPARGSYFFIGVLLLDLELPVDDPFADDRCGTCRACIDHCPTGALLGRDDRGAPVIDARRCISYLTIELRGSIPHELRPAIGNRIFGCDICQEVCPWNDQFARPTEEEAYRPRAGVDGPALAELADRLLSVDEGGFRELFPRSAIRRAKREGLLRNVCVALGNWGSAEAVPVLDRAQSDPSPVVRAHAAWALGRIGTDPARGVLAARLRVEDVPGVRRELSRAVGDGPPA